MQDLLKRIHIRYFYLCGLIFIALNLLCIYTEFFWFPLTVALMAVLLLAFFATDKLLMLIVLLVPLSVNFEHLDFGLGVTLPTEPLMALLLLVYLFKQMHKTDIDIRLIRHPVAIAIIVNLLWIAFTCLTSSMPVVSVKFLIARLWFVVPFFFMAVLLFQKKNNFSRFIWLYTIPLTFVVVYSSLRLAQLGFDKEHADWVMQPFFKDHAVYAACLAFFIPPVAFFCIDKNTRTDIRLASIIALLVLITGMILSYARAGWISLVTAITVFLLIHFKIRFRTVAIVVITCLAAFFYYQEDILMSLEKNRQDSSSDIAKHIESISNIATDASNLERLNRWHCAWRMFLDKPVAGWGAGTYSFQYAPFQHSTELTIISTNSGDVGNAHSEFLGPLAEEGLLGLLSVLAIIITTCITATRVIRKATDKYIRMLALSIFLGLITYFTHSFLNNFLDYDKASIPFWGFIAMLVAMDIYYTPKQKDPMSGNESNAIIK